MTATARVPAPALRPLHRSSTIRATELADVEQVFDPHVNLVVWERRRSAATTGSRLWPRTPMRLMRSIRAAHADAGNVAEELGIAPDSALARDVAMLCDVFATITGATTLGLRVDVTDRATCPKFHVDRVTLRLMTTYRGPATEWLEGETVQQAQVHDVLFAKGESWPDLACDPCIHRSPQPRAGQTRVLLTLDAL
jgi:hypothetical protein